MAEVAIEPQHVWRTVSATKLASVGRRRSEHSMRVFVRDHAGTLIRCLLDTTMGSNNHTITLKIHEERQSLVADTLTWPVGNHTNTSCPWNIAFIDKRCCSFRYVCDMCNSWRAYNTASKNMDYWTQHSYRTPWWYYTVLRLKEFHDFSVTVVARKITRISHFPTFLGN